MCGLSFIPNERQFIPIYIILAMHPVCSAIRMLLTLNELIGMVLSNILSSENMCLALNNMVTVKCYQVINP
jgi:hypothetical protein